MGMVVFFHRFVVKPIVSLSIHQLINYTLYRHKKERIKANLVGCKINRLKL